MQSRRVFDAAGVGPTLSSGTTEGVNIQPSVLVAPTLTAQRDRGAQPPNVLAVRTANTSANGCGVAEGVGHTLDASGPEAVAYGFKYHVSACAGTTGFEEELAPMQIAGKPPAVVMTDTQPNSLVSDETCGTLTHRMHKDPPVSCYAVRMREGSAGGGKGPLVQEELSGTLATGNDQTIFAVAANQRGEARLENGDGQISGCIPANPSGKQVQAVTDGYVVRRLTPVECERLQGFPDNWSRVPYRGKPAGECPDGPRYKAIGNSMAVPVMRWIGRRILAVECLYGGAE